jgi:hypothetical protein
MGEGQLSRGSTNLRGLAFRGSQWASPGQSMKGFLIQIGDGLHVISRRLLQLRNTPSMWEVVFKYKEKNLGMLHLLEKVPCKLF